ncbi:hypothetical protein [Sphingobium sp. CAP-1]|uniref:hypothetical protein n=1 Tax=Sphingobium sp. CAP-1 TaxID=2676077 RepID=UPI0012BB3B03|nr:hypothetical protein [Sphingobium sp. CAP-1]QGP79986.1 hypothetical protein GL174_14090 [Sphingobium sp. CAP-1]
MTSTSFVGGLKGRQALFPASSSAALGLRVSDIIRPLINANYEGEIYQAAIQPPSLAERVFTALADAKIWTSKIAMHISVADRDRYFRQLDLLHDCDDWFEDDSPIQLESYKSFIRFMLFVNSPSKPSLAMSSRGILSAIWINEADRLTVEFEPNNAVRWVVSHKVGELTERAAGTTTVDRLMHNLEPYNPQGWFGLA